MLWGSSEDKKFSAENILSNEADFSNSTSANYWLAKENTVEGQGFVMKVGNSKRKIVGVHVRNIHNVTNGDWATKIFYLEGALLKDPETLAQRGQLPWTPEILKKAGRWEELLTKTLKNKQSPLQTFFFEATTEIRYLWFHLLKFHGRGGGLQYFAPILQSGEPCAYL